MGLSRGSHLYVACWSVCDRIKIFDQQNVCLIVWSEALDCLIFLRVKGQRSNCSHAFLILDFCSLEVPLIPWKSALIAWFYFDPGCKRFYTGHISDYPLFIVWFMNTCARQFNTKSSAITRSLLVEHTRWGTSLAGQTLVKFPLSTRVIFWRVNWLSDEWGAQLPSLACVL